MVQLMRLYRPKVNSSILLADEVVSMVVTVVTEKFGYVNGVYSRLLGLTPRIAG